MAWLSNESKWQDRASRSLSLFSLYSWIRNKLLALKFLQYLRSRHAQESWTQFNDQGPVGLLGLFPTSRHGSLVHSAEHWSLVELRSDKFRGTSRLDGMVSPFGYNWMGTHHWLCPSWNRRIGQIGGWGANSSNAANIHKRLAMGEQPRLHELDGDEQNVETGPTMGRGRAASGLMEPLVGNGLGLSRRRRPLCRKLLWRRNYATCSTNRQ